MSERIRQDIKRGCDPLHALSFRFVTEEDELDRTSRVYLGAMLVAMRHAEPAVIIETSPLILGDDPERFVIEISRKLVSDMAAEQ